MGKTKITRGITKEFANALAASELYELYKEHNDELFLGIRNERINLYYNASSVCRVTYDNKRKKLNCSTHKKYIKGLSDSDDYTGNDYREVPIEKIVSDYEQIKKDIDTQNAPEKIAQQKLVHLNNINKESKWFCIDIEYIKQRDSKLDEEYGRFDIVAISKEKPHRVALAELKYGKNSLGSSSGIVKHAKDYAKFKEDCILSTHMKKEIFDIVANLNTLEICPIRIKDKSEINDEPEFYFITLNNNPETEAHSTPKMTMGGYVFNKNNPKFIKIGSKEQASITVESELGVDITNPANEKLYAKFLFSKDTIDNISIKDIIDDQSYDRDF